MVKIHTIGNLDAAKICLETHGYCLIAGALPKEVIVHARNRLLDQARAEMQRGIAFRDGGCGQEIVDQQGYFRASGFSTDDGGVNQRVFMLINKGQCFRDMVVHPLVDELVGHVLGKDFILSTLSANIANPGGVRMGLHTDQWWMPQPTRAGASYRRPSNITRDPATEFVEPDKTLGIAPPVTTTAVWMLSDFRKENGATEIVPDSHLSGAYPKPGDQREYSIIQPEAPAGTLLIFDGRLWHGTGANIGKSNRVAVLSTFCAPQFRQQENYTLGLGYQLWSKLSDKLKSRLGYKVWNGYGRIEKQFSGYVQHAPELIGELYSDSETDKH